MPHSNSTPDARKPHPDFPLSPRKGENRWCKKIRGKMHYFTGTAQEALDEWLRVKDDLLAGRSPRIKGDGLTIGKLCNRFLEAKDQQLAAGEIRSLTRNDYKLTTDRLVAEFGATRLVTDLRSEDFEALRASISKTRGPVALGNEIQRARVVFKYGYDAGLIDQPMRYGPLFKRPSRKVLRLARAKAGPKLFEAADVLRMLDTATPQLKAMILLAVNCGFGNNDCGTLTLSALDLDGGWISFPRPKTGVDRRCPLWPETAKALRDVLASRRTPKDEAHSGLVFITAALGSFAKETTDSPIAKEFAKLMKSLGLEQKGRGFYSLRHTFRTVADESRDQPACDFIMGHSADDMASRYRERIGDDRLQAVSKHVRGWLYPPKPAKRKTTAKRTPKRRQPKPQLKIVG